jgi:hypothetical protein
MKYVAAASYETFESNESEAERTSKSKDARHVKQSVHQE